MQKILIFSLFLLSFNGFASATCDDLRKDILALEYKANMTNHNEAYFADIKIQYDEALAKLILLQGMNAIAQGVVGANNALRTLSESDNEIEQATEYVRILTENIHKADMLSQAMTPLTRAAGGNQNQTDRVSFLMQYQNDLVANTPLSQERFRENISRLCSPESGAAREQALCTFLNNFKDQNNIDDYPDALLETLQAFFQTDYRTRLNNDLFPGDDYATYNEFLRFRNTASDNTEIYDATAFKDRYIIGTTDNPGALTSMQTALTNYQTTKNEDNAQAVFAAARQLDDLEIAFEGRAEDDQDLASSTMDNRMKAFYRAQFTEPLNAIEANPTDLIYTRIWEKNLDNQIAKLENQQRLLEQGQLEASRIGSAEPLDLGVLSHKSRIGQITGYLEQAKQCYRLSKLISDDPQEMTKYKCLNDLRDNKSLPLSTDIAQTRNTVNELKAKLDSFYDKSEFEGLKVLKGLALNAYDQLGCSQNGELEGSYDYSCASDIGLQTTEEFINLGQDMANIQIQVDEDWAREEFGLDDTSTEAFRNTRDEFITSACGGEGVEEQQRTLNPAYFQNICRYYTAAAEERELNANAFRNDQAAIQANINRTMVSASISHSVYRPQGPSNLRVGAMSILQGVGSKFGDYMAARRSQRYIDQQQAWVDSLPEQNRLRLAAQDRYANALSDCRANPQSNCGPFMGQMWQNHQRDLWVQGMQGQANFQLQNMGTNFPNPNNPYQFNIPVTSSSTNLSFTNQDAFGNFGGGTGSGFTPNITPAGNNTPTPSPTATPFSF